LEDPRIERLRSLIAEATEMQAAAKRLIEELNEQLHMVMSADDREIPVERRRKPRT
jgi:hypothetical protein